MNHHEIETKVLEVDPDAIKSRLEQLGARQLQDVLLTVDWYRDPHRQPDQDEWYLRIRTSSDGKLEVTWKAKADRMSVARKVKEISFHLDHPDELAALFEGIGLECYAHQEKYRTSWEFKDWRFDLDRCSRRNYRSDSQFDSLIYPIHSAAPQLGSIGQP